jgi:hypothetical protein
MTKNHPLVIQISIYTHLFTSWQTKGDNWLIKKLGDSHNTTMNFMHKKPLM